VDAAHAILWDAQHFRDRAAQRINALAMRPDGQLSAFEQRDRARWADRRMHLIGTTIAGFDHPGTCARRRRRAEDGRVLRRQSSEIGIQIRLHRQRGLLVPDDALGRDAHRAHGFEFLASHDRDEIPVAHELQKAGHALDVAGAKALQSRAVAGRADHAGMNHVGQAKIVDVARAAGDFRRDVDALHRLSHRRALLRIAQRRLRLRGQVQRLAGHQLAIGNAAAIARAHHAIADFELSLRHVEARGREAQQRRTNLGGRIQDRRAAVLHRLAARRVALVGRALRVRSDELDPAR
jgi:hypothetical protein